MSGIILMDTSFLTAAVHAKVDFLAGLTSYGSQLVATEGVMAELAKLARSGVQQSVYAAVAEQQLKQADVFVLPGQVEGHADEDIFTYAVSNMLVVATQDKALKKALQFHAVPTLCIRQQRYITWG